jgi:ribosomal protein L13E
MSALDLIAFDSVQATGYNQTTARTLRSAVDQRRRGILVMS